MNVTGKRGQAWRSVRGASVVLARIFDLGGESEGYWRLCRLYRAGIKQDYLQYLTHSLLPYPRTSRWCSPIPTLTRESAPSVTRRSATLWLNKRANRCNDIVVRVPTHLLLEASVAGNLSWGQCLPLTLKHPVNYIFGHLIDIELRSYCHLSKVCVYWYIQ